MPCLTLSGNELEMYEHLYGIISRDIPSPDIIIYLKSSTELLMKRIRQRARSFEQNISYQYMENLNNHYENYFSDQSEFTRTKLRLIILMEWIL